MITTNKPETAPGAANTCVLKAPLGKDGRVAEDLLVAFEPQSGLLSDDGRDGIERWVESWLARNPGAVVVMGGNDKSRNSDRSVRETRLQSLSGVLAGFGISEYQVRYTDEAVDLECGGTPISPERGAVCMKVFRPSILDGTVMPIRDLFRSRSSWR